MTSVDNLEYHLAGFIAIQTIIFVVINKPGIHNLQSRRIGESGTKLLYGSSRHRSSRLLGTVIAGIVLALEIIETVITSIVGIKDLRIISYRSITIITSRAPLYSILLVGCFTVSLRLICLTSDDSTYNSSTSHADDGSHIRASRTTGQSTDGRTQNGAEGTSSVGSTASICIATAHHQGRAEHQKYHLFHNPII